MKMKKLALSLGFIGLVAGAATISRIKNFSDGQVLFASDLNAEFNNIINAINGGLDNDNLAANANISPLKLSTAIDGDAISRSPSTGALSVAVDDVTIGVTNDVIAVKPGGIATISIASGSITTEKLALGSVTSQIIAVSGVTTQNLAPNSVTFGKIADDAVGVANQVNVVDFGPTADPNEVAISNSTSFQTTSSSFVDATNFAVTITTTGRPLSVSLATTGIASATLDYSTSLTGGAWACEYMILEGVNVVAWGSIGGNSTTGVTDFHPVGGIGHPAFVTGAGVHSLKLQMRRSFGNGTCRISNAVLVAREI